MRLTAAVVIILCVAGGCKKAKPTPTPAAAPAPEPAVARAAEPVEDRPPPVLDRVPADEPNLPPLIGEVRPAAPVQPAPAPQPAAQPQRPPATPPPSAAVGTTRDEIKRALEDIRIFIDNASLASGRMPTPEFTYQAVQQAAPQHARLIYERKIVLHPARTREDVWAYEGTTAGPTVYVLFATGVEEMNTAAFRRRLGR